MKTSWNQALVVAIGFLMAVLSSDASALTIDNFESGGMNLSVTTGTASSNNLNLPTGNVLGGTRAFAIGTNTTGQTASIFSLLSSGDDAVEVTTDSGGGQGQLFYDGFTIPFDLTASGALDRFEIDLTAASVAGEVEALIRVNTGGTVFRRAVAVSGPGLVSIPYADFAGSPDFTDISLIGLLIRPGGAGTIAVTDFSAVPEPSTAALLGLGMVTLATWRRRSLG